MRTIRVHCRKGGTLLRSYDFAIGETLNDAAVALPSHESLVSQAKDNLTTEGLAAPPYTGISFEVVYP